MLVMMTTSDLDLLKEYAGRNSEEAFATLVKRHLNLVYSAALRQVRSPQLAEEVSQSVFSDLAQNAHKLRSGTILTAWLYQVTRRTAIDVVRREAHRQRERTCRRHLRQRRPSGASRTRRHNFHRRRTHRSRRFRLDRCWSNRRILWRPRAGFSNETRGRACRSDRRSEHFDPVPFAGTAGTICHHRCFAAYCGAEPAGGWFSDAGRQRGRRAE